MDKASKERLYSQRVKTSDKLYLIARYIEEKYQFEHQPNHWDSTLEGMEQKESVFYKVWLWLNYVEYEGLVRPVKEFIEVFGEEKNRSLSEGLAQQQLNTTDLENFYTLEGEAGKVLLKWGIKEVIG
ncbi:hypothetical protein V6R21_04680 [Limibacter armeniacum]|uniref:hypothetical protein n=1 Tax=Limibacter armeniacum TaxID=466084 RepID=UPI002FE5EC64